MRRSGFSVIELAIVIVIIGILAMIAIPRYTDLQLRAKTAELEPNVDAMRDAELLYEVAFGTFIMAPNRPLGVPGAQPRPWDPDDDDGYDDLGWAPDGELRGQYDIEVIETGFQVKGITDCDENGLFAEVVATNTREAVRETPDDVF